MILVCYDNEIKLWWIFIYKKLFFFIWDNFKIKNGKVCEVYNRDKFLYKNWYVGFWYKFDNNMLFNIYFFIFVVIC